MRLNLIGKYTRMLSTQQHVPKVCIVGAGPAGFYAAQQLLKVTLLQINIDNIDNNILTCIDNSNINGYKITLLQKEKSL